MDTTAVFRYLKNSAKIGFSFVLFASLVSCPGDDMDCNDIGSIAEAPDLILLVPEQTEYTRGDEIILQLEIPASNIYYGSEIDIHAITRDENARLVLGFDQLFLENTLMFTKGSQGEYPNWFDMPYDPITDQYEFDLKIILNRTGVYSFYSGESFSVQGSDYCNRYFIDTNVQWNYTNGKIEFTVNE